VNYNNTAVRYIGYAVAAAALLILTAKFLLVTAVVLQLILLIGVAVYLSKRFDAMWVDLEEDMTTALSEIRNDVADLRQELRELRETRGTASQPWATRPAASASRGQPGPTPVSAIFREWE
jgi:hypothetical protein